MPTTRSATAGEDLVFGGGIAAPQYQQPWSVPNSCAFYKAYKEYERSVAITNSGQTVQRPVLKLSQLLPENVRWCLADEYFEEQGGSELAESDLLRVLAQHGECWESAEVDPAKVVSDMESHLAMGSEPTAMERIDAVRSRMEEFCANSSVGRVFRDSVTRKYVSGPARVITAAVLRGLKPPEFKENVQAALKLQDGSWKENPTAVFRLVRAEASKWRLVEQAKSRRRSRARKTTPGGKGGAEPSTQGRSRPSAVTRTCWTCGATGHKSRACTSAGKGARGSGSAPSGGGPGKPAARQQGPRKRGPGAPQGKGTPATRESAPSKPASAPGAAVGGRAAVPAAEDTHEGCAASGGLPPNPISAGAAAPGSGGEGAAPVDAGAKVSSWRAVAPGGQPGDVEVDAADGTRLVDLSIPGAAHPTVCPVKAVLDSGAGLGTIPPSIARRMQDVFPDVAVVSDMTRAQPLRAVDGRELTVTEKTCPVRVALHTAWGPVVLDPQPLAVMPGTDDVMIIGKPMLKRLGIDVDAAAEASARARHDDRLEGVESPDVAAARRVALSIAAMQPPDREEVPDKALERLAARGPDMVMPPAQEEQGRSEALDAAVESAATAGLSDRGVDRLRGIVGQRWNAFRRALRAGDPPAAVEPMRVQRKSGARAVKARPRTYNPAKTAWLTTCLATLVAMGLLYLNKQAVWASAVMATPKKNSYRMVGDFRGVNNAVEKSPGVMPNREESMHRLSEATCYGSLDMLQGYWQMPLAPDSQEIFTIVGPGGLYTPTRVPQGVLNATSYSQATMTELLDGLNCMVWVDDVIYWGHNEDDLLNTLELLLERRERAGLCAAAHKSIFFDTSITWCGKVYSRGEIKHDPERLSGLANLRRPETAASSSGDDWKVDVLDAQTLQQHVQLVVEAQTELHKKVLAKVTSELKEVFQHSFTQGEFEMEALLNIGESHDGSYYLVRVRWSGFEEDEDTWEPLKTLWEDAPQFVKQQLRKMKLSRDVHEKLKQQYGIAL
eukprot:g5996.t1